MSIHINIDMNIHIDINMNIDIHIIINMNIENYISYCLLPIGYYLLSITYWLFPIVYNLLAAARARVPGSLFPRIAHGKSLAHVMGLAQVMRIDNQ